MRTKTKKTKPQAQPKRTKPATRGAGASTSGRRKARPFPGSEELVDATWNLKHAVNKAVQKVYDQVLSETIRKLQHARRKTIV